MYGTLFALHIIGLNTPSIFHASHAPPALLAVHDTTIAGSTEAGELQLEYDADERRWVVPAGRRRTAGGSVLQ